MPLATALRPGEHVAAKIFYHGGTDDAMRLHVPRTSQQDREQGRLAGFYTTSDPGEARQSGSVVSQHRMKIRVPLHVYHEEGGHLGKETWRSLTGKDLPRGSDIASAVRRRGYDGVIVRHADGREWHVALRRYAVGAPQRLQAEAAAGGYTYEHVSGPGDHGAVRHMFDAWDHDGESAGFARVDEHPGHAELAELFVGGDHRRNGVGGRLVDNVTDHFRGQGKPVRLTPYPDPAGRGDAPLDEEQLHDFYGRHGFTDDPDADFTEPDRMVHRSAAASGSRHTGVLPGDDLSHLDQPERPVTWVRTDALMRHREWHHGPGWSKAPDGTVYAPRHTPQEWEDSARSVAEHGIRQPIHIAWDPKANRAYLAEGNSRLMWAQQAGHEYVPATGQRSSWTVDGDGYQLRGPSQADAVRARHGDHIPADLSPAEFLPAHYLGPQAHTGARAYPQSEIGPLYHGTTEQRAGGILGQGFTDDPERGIHLTPHPDLAMSYAEGRVLKDGGGIPAVLKIDKVRGVSAEHTGYGKASLNREAGADYMDKGPEVVVLNPSAIHGITRHAALEGFWHGSDRDITGNVGDKTRADTPNTSFFTNDRDHAFDFGRYAYPVEPLGPYEDNVYEGAHPQGRSYTTTHELRVTGPAQQQGARDETADRGTDPGLLSPDQITAEGTRRQPPPGSPHTEHVGDHGFSYIDEHAADIPDYINLGHCRVHDFPLSDITVAGQEFLNPDKLRQYTRQLPRVRGKPPKVILRPYGDNDIAVADGHHTIAGARARGDTHIRARWMDDDPTEDAYGDTHWNARTAAMQSADTAAVTHEQAGPDLDDLEPG